MTLSVDAYARTETDTRINARTLAVGDLIVGAASLESGGNTFAQTYVLDSPMPEDAWIIKIEYYGSSTNRDVFYFPVTKSGSNFIAETQNQQFFRSTDSQVSLASLSGDFNAMLVKKGQYIGFRPKNGLSQLSAASRYYSDNGDTARTFDRGTVKTTTRPQIRFTVRIKTELSVIGKELPANSASNTFSQTYISGSPATSNGYITGVRIHGFNAGDVVFFPVNLSGSNWICDTGNSRTVQSAAGILRTLKSASEDFEAMYLSAGQYIGYRPKNRVALVSETGAYFTDGAGDTDDVFAVGSLVTSTNPQIGFEFTPEDVAFSAASGSAASQTVSIANSEIIAILSDSIAAGINSIESKAWPCHLGNLIDRRVVNWSQPGGDALGMANRIRNGTGFTPGGVAVSDVNVRYVLILTGANDGYMVSGLAEYFQRNLMRAVEICRAAGMTPILVNQISATVEYRLLMRTAAQQVGCMYWDTGEINRRIGGLPSWQNEAGHCTPRSNALYHQPISEFIREQLPAAVRSIKLFRPQPSFSVSAIADLLYASRFERYQRWKEINVFHRTIPTANLEYYDATDEDADLSTGFVDIDDEYADLAADVAVNFNNYALIEIVLPTSDLTSVVLVFNVPSDAAIYARNWDADASIPGRPSQSTVTETYETVWDNPVGAWVAISPVDGLPYTLPTIKGYVKDRLLTLLVVKSGSFTMLAPTATIEGGTTECAESYPHKQWQKFGSQLLTTASFDGSLTGWTAGGTPVSYAPVDQANSPWAPAAIGTAVSHVAEITAANTIAQSVVIAQAAFDRWFALDIYHRYNPLAYVDPTGRGWASGRYVDRTDSTYPDDAPINSDTFDLRQLEIEIVAAASFPSRGGARQRDISPTQWKRTRVIHFVPAGTAGDFTFRLGATSGTIEVAVVELYEVR